MENNYQTNTKLNSTLVALCLYILVSFGFFYSVYNLIGLVTDEFVSLEVQLPKIILYMLPLIYFAALFKNMFYTRSRKLSVIIFVVLTTLLVAFSFVLMGLNFDYFLNNYFSSYFNSYTPVDLFLIGAGLLFANIVIIDYAISGRYSKEYRDPTYPGVMNIYHGKRAAFAIILGLISSFFLADFIKGLFLVDYFVYFTLEYIINLLLLVLPFVNLVFYLALDFNKSKSVFAYGFMGIFDLLFMITFVLFLQFDPAFINAEVNQPLFVVTYSCSIPIGYCVCLIALLAFVINIIINFVSFKKKAK